MHLFRPIIYFVNIILNTLCCMLICHFVNLGLDGEAQIKELTNLVSRLPADNYSVLSCVISFLTEVNFMQSCQLLFHVLQ